MWLHLRPLGVGQYKAIHPQHESHIQINGNPKSPQPLGNGPTIVRDKGRLKLVFGSPGGETIGQTQFQFLVNIVDRGMPVQAAIEAPRFALDDASGLPMAGADPRRMGYAVGY
ncbi:gamma-glutamyltransferase [Sphingobium rhizovicinum]|uniref:Gamma-glutamyltransferase n=1 Tax=Sphingobium rhizovicinum TaxID=432308 RepID=A0ABV7NLH4_9SPHN